MSTGDIRLEHAIAVSLLTGFLGSGKTTLLNYLLAHEKMDRTAVLINEFGEVGLDHLIVRELDEDVVLLKSGCICCTVQGQLVDGLKDLYFKRLAGHVPPFTRILIETTGLADPLPIMNCLMRDPLFGRVYYADTVLTTVDAVYGSAQLDRHEEAVRQAAIADRIVITKSDMVSHGATDDLRERLVGLNPGARIIVASFGQVSPVELFGRTFFDLRSKLVDVRRRIGEDTVRVSHHDGDGIHPHDRHGTGEEVARTHRHVDANRHDAHIRSFCITIDEPIPWNVFKEWYGGLAEKKGDRLLRVKGILKVQGEVKPLFLNCVQSVFHEPTPLPSWPDDDRRSRIVFITHDLSREAVEESLRSCLTTLDARLTNAPQPPPALHTTNSSRWLNQAELSRLFAALVGQKDREAVQALRLVLLTGASSEDMRTACWEEFDMERGVWLKTAPAVSVRRFNRQPRRITLHPIAIGLLVDMSKRGSSTGRLFPRLDAARLDNTWTAALRSAGIDDLPLDKLPPTLAVDMFAGLAPELVRSLTGDRQSESRL